EFRRKWGNRELRDNWRFSDMATAGGTQAIAAGLKTAGEEPGVTADTVVVDSAAWVAQLRDSYLRDLPDTEEKIAESNRQIHDALLRVGNIYRDELRDNEEAAATYKALLNRYPETEEAALLYYNLYRLYTDVDDQQAAYYRDKL